jgi:MFS family permease
MNTGSASARIAWLVFVMATIASIGNSYVYDSIGPVADLLEQQRHFTDTQIGVLNAIYNLPNIVLLILGGFLVDRFGAGAMTLATATVCFLGAVLTAWGGGFTEMATGRLLFGIGAETFNIASLAAIIDYFAGRRLALAIGLSLAFGRGGSYGADMSPTWFAHAYAQGWQPPLIIAAVIAGTSVVAALIYFWIDRPRANAVRSANAAQPFVMRDMLKFGKAYWYLLILCVLWYSVIFAFRSTFSIKYFQHAHGLDLATAGAMNSYVFLAAIFATPLFGWICDRTGRYAPLLAFGAFLLPVAMSILAYTHWSLWIATALIGVSFSLVPAVMWPLTSRVVPTRVFGTALGLMWVVQNAGIGGANLAAGWLNDSAGASSTNPAGYLPMMEFFITSSAIGFVFAVVLWRTAGRRAQEAATHAAATPAIAVPG